MMELSELTDDIDVLLMREFRQERWDEWVLFCAKKGFRPVIEKLK